MCVTDADSILDPTALAVMVRPFLEDPERVVAVGGTVRVGNASRIEDGQMIEPRVPRGFVAGFQLIEYLRAFLLGRTGWDRFNALMIVSGAFGLFRRDLLERRRRLLDGDGGRGSGDDGAAAPADARRGP